MIRAIRSVRDKTAVNTGMANNNGIINARKTRRFSLSHSLRTPSGLIAYSRLKKLYLRTSEIRSIKDFFRAEEFGTGLLN
jgi:hypothetical protein